MMQNEINCCCKSRYLNVRRFLCTSRINSEILSDFFGLTQIKSKLFVEKHRLQNRNGELVMNSIKFCRSLGYDDDDILEHPGLLRIHPLELEQHYLALEEGGFQSIGPKILVRARNYMKRVIRNLKEIDVIPDKINVPKNFLNFIQDEHIKNKISVHQFTDDDKWNEVHKFILESFLRLRLDTTNDEIIKLFRIHRMIKNKSFRIVQENIAIAKNLGFDERKIIKHGYILHNYPTYPKTVLKDFPNLAGSDMRKAMWLYPKLIMTSPNNIIKIYGILKEFHIEDEVIRKQMNVFHMSPDTVRLRLEEIERSPDFRVLLKHPRVLSLIVHHNRAKSRLSFLQQLQLRCASLIVLGTDNKETFNDYVREGKDVNKYVDVIVFLKKLFNVNDNCIKKKMKNHPYFLQVPLKDMQDTYDYLINHNFQPPDILKVLHILLYPQEKIENAVDGMKTNKEIKFSSLTQIKKLILALYFMEREHHFTGNGIWKKPDNETGKSEKPHDQI